MARSIMSSAPQGFRQKLRAWWEARSLYSLIHPPEPVDPITQFIERRFAQYLHQEYKPLGIITELWTPLGQVDPQKVIGFGTGKGPALGMFADGRPDLLDAWDWDGLPDRYEQLDEQCPECLVQCNECWPGAYPLDSSGTLASGHELKDGERPCIYGSPLAACGGSGYITVEGNQGPCPTCGATGKVKCKRCYGSAMMSTGRAEDGRLCPACLGTQRVRKALRQNFAQYLAPQSFHDPVTSLEASYELQGNEPFLKKTLYLGPIIGLMLSGLDKRTQIWVGKPDMNEDLPHIVSQNFFRRNSRAVILGGVLRLK